MLEDVDEFAADDLAFAFGVGHAAELGKEFLGGVDIHKPDLEVSAEDLLNDRGLVFAQQAVVDEDTSELVADGLVQKGGGHARIDASREPEDHLLTAHLLADRLAAIADGRGCRPPLTAFADPMDEIGQDILAAGRVCDLRMELKAEEAFGRVLEGGEFRVVRFADDAKALRHARDLVAMRIPDQELFGQPGEKSGVAPQEEASLSVLTQHAAGDRAPEIIRHQLKPVADAERRDAELEDSEIRQRRAPGIDARRAAGKDQPGR